MCGSILTITIHDQELMCPSNSMDVGRLSMDVGNLTDVRLPEKMLSGTFFSGLYFR